MLSSWRRLALIVMVGALGVACARSNQALVPSMSEYCARLMREFSAPASDSAYQHALSNMVSCPQQGAPLLAGLWDTPPANDATLEVLVRLTGLLRDGGLYLAAQRIAQAQARPSRERLAALRALVGVYNPRLFAHDWGRPAYPGAPGNAVSIGMSSHVVPRQGPIPLPTAAGAQITDFYATLEQSDSNAQVRYVAKELLQALSYYGPGESVP
jgi:hypothetical protein